MTGRKKSDYRVSAPIKHSELNRKTSGEDVGFPVVVLTSKDRWTFCGATIQESNKSTGETLLVNILCLPLCLLRCATPERSFSGLPSFEVFSL